MLKENFQEFENQEVIDSVVDHLRRKGFDKIKVDAGEFDRPSTLTRRETGEEFVPNITAFKGAGKCYFEFVERKKQVQKKLIEKWSLLSAFASFKEGKLFLIVPNGKLSYTQRLLKNNDNIDADIMPLKIIQ
ncbi:hypothetical protein [Chondrinema litorale]|uniref:hypothetical protein n=1 Tax=Chondrinema litorale TaxID=2994555 RepID=UPI000C5B6D30|nr:hypothetical protein [Chondrinema litorale]MBT29433.1 hypothetical protein [Thalassovita sp.]UZR92554.1 hypothetical protein OQ292_11850 [Chondrinema litorale]